MINSFGGKYLKNKGWEGRKLNEKGKNRGLEEPIQDDYRHPADRAGLGYFGEKLDIEKIRSNQSQDRVIVLYNINTVYILYSNLVK